jgi:hypothetical protein
MHGVRMSKAKVRTMRARFAKCKSERIARNRAIGACDECSFPNDCARWVANAPPFIKLACGAKPESA